MAKKKKPVANPARGFATTSIASKPKPERATEPEIKTPKKEVSAPSTTSAPTPLAANGSQAPTNVVQQSPEALEAQLERDELQLLVEKHASKVRRDSRRQVSRFQTDQRVLRPQSQPLTVNDWLPGDILDRILTLAHAESNDSNRRQGQQPLLKVFSEEEAMSRLWSLELTLRDLGFSENHIQPVLQYICANAASIDATAGIWGFQEALEWLALNQNEEHAFSYEEPKAKQPLSGSPQSSRPSTPEIDSKTLATGLSPATMPTQAATATLLPVSAIPDSESSDVAISDLDSDIEPDEVVPTYLKIKGRLFKIDPDAVDANAGKPRKKSKGRGFTNKVESPAVRKLRSQLQQLESDVLFNQDEADALWPAKRNQIAQAKAAEKKSQPQEPISPNKESSPSKPVKDEAPTTPAPGTDNSNNEDDDGMLGGMFAAVPDEPIAATTGGDASSDNVVVKDFGKQSGMSPRRIFEEAIRARDPGARLAYKLVSPTVYACRHSLTIMWSKHQDIDYDEDIDGVSCHIARLKAIFTATTVATVSVEQSENYISTAALFSVFAASAKEEKLHLRLPSNWRDLYKAFLDHRRDRLDGLDRETIKRFQTLIQEQIDNEELDGVVLTNRFKMRNQAASNSSPSGSGRNTPLHANESLVDFWGHKSCTPGYQRMLPGRMNLPVFGFRESILSTIDKNQVTIICGETGCGKSTQIPSFILEHELSQGKPCKIFCTEPRRISAISLAQRVSEELGESPHDLGTFRSVVGYAIRLESKMTPQTRLVYATVGVVLRMLESSGRLDEVTHLVIDEVHERSIDSDFLLIILRSLMLIRSDLKVILMSATVDSDRFSKYLNNAPVLNIPGRTFPVQVRYLEDAIELTHYSVSGEGKLNDSDTSENEEESKKEKSGIPSKLPGYSSLTRDVLSNYDEYAIDYELIIRLLEIVAYDQSLSDYSSAFLIFLPGLAEIRQLNDMILGHPSFDRDWLVYPLHSSISSEDQQAAFRLPPPGVRKIVIATNIAETGVTIPDITCVIDTGKHKEMRFDERRQLSRLTQSFIARANAKQRRGRAGRVQEGLCFHLFTKYRHDNLMMDQQTPEMLRLSLQDLVMRTKICKLGDIEKTLSEALDPPSARNIRRAIDALIEVDALTSSEELTPLGRQIAQLPLDAHLGKLVLLSSMFGCVDVAITVAAILSSKSPFLTPFGAKQRADIARLSFRKGDSDLLTAYNAYTAWKNACTTTGRSEASFCHKNFLSAQNLSNIEDLKAQLLNNLVEAGFVQLSVEDRRALSRYRSTARRRMFVTVPPQYDIHSTNDILVNSVIATALYPKILIREGKGWRNIANNQTVSLAPTSVNKSITSNPSSASIKFLSYYHIMQSSSKFYNAHSTSIVHALPMVLMVGADMDFKLHAGVIGLPGNALKFAVRDLRAVVALKALRRRVKEIVNLGWKNSGRTLSGRESEWLGLFFRVFEERFAKDEKIRERAGGKAK